MAYDFTTKTEWMGQADPQVFFADQVEGLPAPSTNKIYKRKGWVVSRYRYGQGIIPGTSVIDTEETGGISFQNGSDTVTIGVGEKFRCSEDSFEPDPPGSGIWKQTQRWAYFTTWAEVDLET